jgi:steroid 5-alpha reductase family enzyme
MINLQIMYITLVDAFTIYGAVLLIIVSGIFIIAQIKADNSIMDIAYGPTFLLAALGSILVTKNLTPLTGLVLAAITLWSLRLAVRIYKKNHGQPEDARYAAWRTAWQKQGFGYFLLRSYVQINLLQGFIILLVASPFVISLTSPTITAVPLFSWSVIIGLMIYITGLTIESLADYQLDQFIARKKAGTESAVLMTSGLFRYSRRPNYFGETLIWWGLAIMVLPLPFGYLALVSPLLITYIVTCVTGPMLEKIFLARNAPEYREYMRTTSYFIPLPPKT